MRLHPRLLALCVLLACAVPACAAGLSVHHPRGTALSTQAVTTSLGFSTSDGVGTWNTCGFIVSPTGMAETMYGTTVVDSSGQATATNHGMDGTTWTDVNAFTISSDGKIQMNGVDWGVMSCDRNTAIGYSQQDGSVGLTICVRAGSGYTLEDAIGHWRINALQVGSVWTGWTAIDADLDATGALSGTIADSDGGSNPFSTHVSISPDGVMSGEEDGGITAHAFMSTNGQFFVQVAGAVPASGVERIDIGMLGGGDFITADLAGEWHFYTITKSAMLFEGTFTAQPDGSITGTNRDVVHNITNPVSGTIGVTAQGVISFDEASSDLEGQGTLSLDRSTFIFAFTDHAHEDDKGFIIGTKYPTDLSASVDVSEVDMDWGNGFSFSENFDLTSEGTLCDLPAVPVYPSNFQTPQMPPTGTSAAAGLVYSQGWDTISPTYSPGKIILPTTLQGDGGQKDGRFMPELDLDGWTWPTRTGDIVLRARIDAFEGDLAPQVGNGALSTDVGFSIESDRGWLGDVWMSFGFATLYTTEAISEIPSGYHNRKPFANFGCYNTGEEQSVVKPAEGYDPAYPVDLKVVITPGKLARGYVHYNQPGSDWILIGEQQVDWWPADDTSAGGCGTGVGPGEIWYSPYVGSALQYINTNNPDVTEPVDIITTELADGTQDSWYGQNLEATGGSGMYFWEIVDGELPPGLSLQTMGGQISGNPYEPGTYHFTVRASDPLSESAEDTQEYTLVINPNLAREIVGTWGFHSIYVTKPPAAGKAVYGSMTFDQSGTASVTRVQMDGTMTSDSFQYTVQPDGTITANGRPWGTLSFDNKRILGMRYDPTQAVLTLCAKLEGSQVPTQFDAEGSWAVHSFEIGPSWQGWRYVQGDVDEWGDFIGTQTNSDGLSVPYLANMIIENGVLTLQEAWTSLAQHSVMSTSGLTFGSLMGDTASAGTARFDIGVRTGADFVQQDLEGTWWIYGISSIGNVFRAWASVSADGSYTGETFDSSTQTTEPISGTMNVTPDGQVTITDSEGSNEGNYTLSMDRAFFAGNFSDGDDRFMMLAAKRVEAVSSQVDVTHVYMNWGNGFSFNDPLTLDTPGTPCPGIPGVTIDDSYFTHPALPEGGTAKVHYAFPTSGDFEYFDSEHAPTFESGKMVFSSTCSPYGSDTTAIMKPEVALDSVPWTPQTQDLEIRATFGNIQGRLATLAGNGGLAMSVGVQVQDGQNWFGSVCSQFAINTLYAHRGLGDIASGYYSRQPIALMIAENQSGQSFNVSPVEGYQESDSIELKLLVSPTGLATTYVRFGSSEEWIQSGQTLLSFWPGVDGWANGCYSQGYPSGSIRIAPYISFRLETIDLPGGPTIEPVSIPNGTVGRPYSQQLYAWDGWPPYHWSITNGALPAGLTFSDDGMLSGTPSEGGVFRFTIRVDDGQDPPAAGERQYTLYVFEPKTINDAKTIPDWVPYGQIMLRDVVVTRKTEDGFYVEDPHRTAGILVLNQSNDFVAEGWMLDIEGWVFTTEDGEKALSAQTIRKVSNGSVRPMGMALRNLGGTDFGIDPAAPTSGQRGVEGGAGTNNIGLLVKTWGRVTQIDPSKQYFYIEDGSSLRDGTKTSGVDNEGVRVRMDPLGLQPGDHVTVTGISSCFKTADDQLHRMIRAADAQVHFPAAPAFVMGLRGENGAGSCRIVFSTVSGATGYRLYQSANGTDYSPVDAAPMLLPDHGMFDVTASGNTYYRIRALGAGGIESPFSQTVYARVMDQHLDMSLAYPSGDLTGVSLSPEIFWQAVPGAVSYGIEIHRDSGGNTLTPWGGLFASSVGNSVRYGQPSPVTYVKAQDVLQPGTRYWIYAYALDAGNWAFATSGDVWFTTEGSSGGGGDDPPPPPI